MPVGHKYDCRCAPCRGRVRRLAAYGLTPREYDSILDEQGSRCAICGRPPGDARALAVDHDHKTGEIRGLLCYYCNNKLIGRHHGERAIRLLARAAFYLKDPPARRVLLGLRNDS